jgi:hypothetical protein
MRDRTVREPREREQSGSIIFGQFFGVSSSSIYEVVSTRLDGIEEG